MSFHSFFLNKQNKSDGGLFSLYSDNSNQTLDAIPEEDVFLQSDNDIKEDEEFLQSNDIDSELDSIRESNQQTNQMIENQNIEKTLNELETFIENGSINKDNVSINSIRFLLNQDEIDVALVREEIRDIEDNIVDNDEQVKEIIEKLQNLLS